MHASRWGQATWAVSEMEEMGAEQLHTPSDVLLWKKVQEWHCMPSAALVSCNTINRLGTCTEYPLQMSPHSRQVSI